LTKYSNKREKSKDRQIKPLDEEEIVSNQDENIKKRSSTEEEKDEEESDHETQKEGGGGEDDKESLNKSFNESRMNNTESRIAVGQSGNITNTIKADLEDPIYDDQEEEKRDSENHNKKRTLKEGTKALIKSILPWILRALSSDGYWNIYFRFMIESFMGVLVMSVSEIKTSGAATSWQRFSLSLAYILLIIFLAFYAFV